MRIFFLAAIFIVCGSFDASAEFKSAELFRKGYWRVELTKVTDDNSFWCSAETSNTKNQSFSVTTFDDRSAMLMIFDPSWELTRRPVKFIVDIDYDRWTIDGRAGEKAVSVFLEGNGKASSFLEDLANGSGVALYNSQEQRLATFSLRGSRDALLMLLKCWEKIVSKDPFGNDPDPF